MCTFVSWKGGVIYMNLNEKINEIINNMPSGNLVFVQNIETGESKWSKEAAEYLGVSGCELCNTQDFMKEITHPEDRGRVKQEFIEVISKKKETFYLNFKIRNSNISKARCTI